MVGLIGRKVGMTQVFDEKGVLIPVTVIHIEDNVVVQKRVADKNGYSALVLGSVDKKKSRITKPYAGQFGDKITPKRFLLEIRDFDQDANIGDSLGVDLFQNLEFVDVRGVSKGKGYQGVMKRHGFHGGPGAHGAKFHRENGSTGMNTFPGHTLPGTRMPGRMGGDRTTVQNLRVVRIDAANKALLVKGAIPGTRESLVVVTQAKKR